MTDDRANKQQTDPNFSDRGIGNDIRQFLANPAPAKPGRTRNLRATFRPAPGAIDSDPGFPGTRTFAPHRLDRRAAGATEPAAGVGSNLAPADSEGSDDYARRSAPVLEAGPGNPTTVGPGESAAARAGGRGIRGRGEARIAVGSADRRAKSAAVGAVKGRRGRPPGKKVEKPIKAGVPVVDKILSADKPDKSASPSATKVEPTSTERADARRLFREIGERFNVNRKKSKTAAYAAYRHDLMANLDTLIMGGAIDLKEVTTVITGLEQYTKETEAESTETPATILGRWLRMDTAEVTGLEVGGPAEPIDANDHEEEDKELEIKPAEDSELSYTDAPALHSIQST